MSAPGPDDFNRRALDPKRSVVIEACAGSGKTWLLVARLVRLLLAGVKPGEILAITFTRKAAQEMESRLRSWLYELAVAPDDAAVRKFLLELALPESEVEAAIPRARGLYEASLTAQPALTVTTFHSWFLRLLQAAPLDAGVLGDVSLIEHTAPLIDEAWERFAVELERAPQAAAALGLEKLFAGYGLQSTRDLLLAFLRCRAEWWAYTRHTRSRDAAVGYALERLRIDFNVDPHLDVCAALFADGVCISDLREFSALLDRNTASDKKAAVQILEALAIENAAARLAGIVRTVLTAEGAARVRKPSAAQAKRLGSAGEQRLLELNASLSERLMRAQRSLTDQEAYRINEAGLSAGAALLDAYTRVKEERHAIDFSDIERCAYEVLATGDHATFLQYKLDARYRHVLLDEFQDTNPLQWLTLDAWFTAAREAASLPTVFMVGDPKQSIYRFRRAEARLYAEARRYLKEHFHADADLKRDSSRRCAQPIIDLVNQVFAQEPEFNAHSAHYTQLPGRVEVLPLVGRNADIVPESALQQGLRNSLLTPFAEAEDRRREDEARAIAEKIRAIVGHWMLAPDGHATAARAADYRDIMILVRSRTHLATYERALRHAHIPFVTSGRGGLLGTLEAQDLMALLTFLISPYSDLALAQVLRSPMFGCADEDLMALARAAGDTWWSRLETLAAGEGAPVSHALSRAARLLALWLARADALPVHDQLDRIYFESDLMRRYGSAVPDAMQGAVTANLQAFIQRALDTDAGRYPSLPRFIRELAELGAAPPEEAPDEGVIGDSGDAVRILTVHGAKGLEAPVVFLIDCAAGPKRERSYDVMVDWPPGAAAPRHLSLYTRMAERSAMQGELAAAEQVLATREATNLMYVAMTRAKQALIVSGVDGKGADDSWYARMRAAAAQLANAADEKGLIALGADLAALAQGVPAGAAAGARAACPIDPRLNAPLATGMRRDATPNQGERYGTHFHRVLELATDAEAGRTRSETELRCEIGLSEREFAPLWAQAQGVLSSPELARFFDRGRYVRAANEVSLVTQSDAIMRIDRVVEFQDEIWFLDYKTGNALSLEQSLLASYRDQMQKYRGVLRQVYPGRRVRGALVFTDASMIEVDESG